ncbi:hypothetical protein B0J11DRAFT_273614 [Dendryphion nanum]|uniref:cyclin-dependent kinase n=1 Tax=Dendryphion nanum TaxID=256645 RepID=A0A9P9E0T9_9PLEO|nr:hypothetical protein B0J11DRAFT_273614 [Dendryphion nanum]
MDNPNSARLGKTSYLDIFQTKLDHEWTFAAKIACYQDCEIAEDCACERPFVDFQEVIRWMKRSDSDDSAQSGEAFPNARRLLIEIHDKMKKHRVFPFPVKHQSILEGRNCCILVFCVLLELGCGELIDIFQDAGVYDSSLKFALPSSLSETLQSNHISHVADLLASFEERKWSYLPLDLRLEMDENFERQNFVIPFCRRRQVNDKGGTASVFHVLIQEKFIEDPDLKNALKKSLLTDPQFGLCYQMALKSYPKSMNKVYEWEKIAFSGLGSHEGSPIVRYLGCYSHHEALAKDDGTTYNLLLEYGQVDLEEYCADLSNVPPVRTMEVIRFWKSLFKVAHAIRNVHNVQIHVSKAKVMNYDGWHADIKPDNILSINGEFKLADFGFAKFSEKRPDERAPMHHIDGGTDTYGAPELARMKSAGTMTPVLQTIDTWSFGCVLSVAATWIVLGFQGIRQYRVLRQLASSNQTPDGKVTDRFHDGFDLLPEIKHWHDFLRNHVRASDFATKLVLDFVEAKMLQTSPNARPDSEMLCVSLDEIMDMAEGLAHKRSHIPTNDSVRQALLIIDESADSYGFEQRPADTISLRSEIQVAFKEGTTASTIHMPVDMSDRGTSKRAGKGARLQKVPLAKTPHRREILEEELKGNPVQLAVKKGPTERALSQAQWGKRTGDELTEAQTHKGGRSHSPTQDNPGSRSTTTREKKQSSTDPNRRRRSSAGHPPSPSSVQPSQPQKPTRTDSTDRVSRPPPSNPTSVPYQLEPKSKMFLGKRVEFDSQVNGSQKPDPRSHTSHLDTKFARKDNIPSSQAVKNGNSLYSGVEQRYHSLTRQSQSPAHSSTIPFPSREPPQPPQPTRPPRHPISPMELPTSSSHTFASGKISSEQFPNPDTDRVANYSHTPQKQTHPSAYVGTPPNMHNSIPKYLTRTEELSRQMRQHEYSQLGNTVDENHGITSLGDAGTHAGSYTDDVSANFQSESASNSHESTYGFHSAYHSKGKARADSQEKEAVNLLSRSPPSIQLSLPPTVYDLDWPICSARETLQRELPTGNLDKLWTKVKGEKKDEYLKNYIFDRDMLIVIDNGTTMATHWPIVEFVAQTIAMKVAGLDEDGIDVKFTVGQYDAHGLAGLAGLGRLKDQLRLARPRPPNNDGERHQTDMSSVLEAIFNSYWTKKHFKATTVIVLTDAVWVPTQPPSLVNEAIVKFATEIQNHPRRFNSRHFTIGFIRFGDEKAEKLKLKHLDDELCDNNGLKDIIDACSWKADVNKLIIGSLHAYQDQRETEDETEEWEDPQSPTSPRPGYDYTQLMDFFENYNSGVTSNMKMAYMPKFNNQVPHPHDRLGRKNSHTSQTSERKKKRDSFLSLLGKRGA